jgi:hypothetical protein
VPADHRSPDDNGSMSARAPSSFGAALIDLSSRIVRSGLVSPIPTMSEIVSALTAAPSSVSSSSRTLGIITALLISQNRVSVDTLQRILEREFCYENAAFLAEAAVLRAHCTAAIADLSSPTTAPSTVDPATPSVSFTLSAAENQFSDFEFSTRETVSSLKPRLYALLNMFVIPSADARVNLSAQCSASLEHAVRMVDAEGATQKALSACISAIRTAEVQIFSLIKLGPVFRFVLSTEYAPWAASTLASFRAPVATEL